jgi:hypothetical protein
MCTWLTIDVVKGRQGAYGQPTNCRTSSHAGGRAECAEVGWNFLYRRFVRFVDGNVPGWQADMMRACRKARISCSTALTASI